MLRRYREVVLFVLAGALLLFAVACFVSAARGLWDTDATSSHTVRELRGELERAEQERDELQLRIEHVMRQRDVRVTETRERLQRSRTQGASLDAQIDALWTELEP